MIFVPNFLAQLPLITSPPPPSLLLLRFPDPLIMQFWAHAFICIQSDIVATGSPPWSYPHPPPLEVLLPQCYYRWNNRRRGGSGTDILVPELLPVGLAQSARITSRRTRFTLQAWHLVERFERFERSRWKQLISFNYRCSMHINLVGVVSLLSLCQLGNLSPCVATIQKT